MFHPRFLLPSALVAMMWCTAAFRPTVAFSTVSRRVVPRAASMLSMSTATPTSTDIIPRVKAVDATEATDGPVAVKGWVRTVRKQKTLAFVEVNDGSNLGGIQCVLSFDAIDDATQEGT